MRETWNKRQKQIKNILRKTKIVDKHKKIPKLQRRNDKI